MKMLQRFFGNNYAFPGPDLTIVDLYCDDDLLLSQYAATFNACNHVSNLQTLYMFETVAKVRAAKMLAVEHYLLHANGRFEPVDLSRESTARRGLLHAIFVAAERLQLPF